MSSQWWSQITSARRMLDAAIDDLDREKNVILTITSSTPWPDDYRQTLNDRLEMDFASRSVTEIDDYDINVGRYMLENHCRKEKRFEYRPPKSVGTFLGESKGLTLDDKILWVKVRSKSDLAEWITFITDYRNAAGKGSKTALFILETDESFSPGFDGRYFARHEIGMDVPEYMKYTFASILADEERVRARFVPYLAQLVTSCCDDVELIPRCIKVHREFMVNPYEVIQKIVADYSKSDGTGFVMDEPKDIFLKRVWEAQLKTLFPYIESYRGYIINLLIGQINAKLGFPYRTSTATIETPYDLELGHILSAIGAKKLEMGDSAEYERLKLFWNARNRLAHLNPIGFSDASGIIESSFGR